MRQSSAYRSQNIPNHPDITIHNKVETILVGLESWTRIDDIVGTEPKQRHDVLENNIGVDYGCPTQIIIYVMTYNEIITNYYKKYLKELGLGDTSNYTLAIALKRTLDYLL